MRRIGPYTERHFDNDLRPGRGKVSEEEQAEIDALMARLNAEADKIVAKASEGGDDAGPQG